MRTVFRSIDVGAYAGAYLGRTSRGLAITHATQKAPAVDSVRTGYSDASDTAVAVADVLAQLNADDAQLVLLFYSPEHDVRKVAELLGSCGADCAVAGSTAGELSAQGFTHGTMSGIALAGEHVRAAASLVPHLGSMSLIPVSSLATSLAGRIGLAPEELDPERHAWLLLLDGMSGREDFFTPYFARHAPRLPIVGGSFADEGRFSEPTLIVDGRVHRDAACVVLLEYARPFELIHHTHMEFSEDWHVVTRTSEGGRLLEELDGAPALEVYASDLGVEVGDLKLQVTGRHPFGYRFKGRPFPCSVMRAEPSGFRLAYSVQIGDQLNLLNPVDMVEKSQQVIWRGCRALEERGGSPQAALLFNCLGRYLEASGDEIVEPLFDALNQLPLCGLNTYGEQFAARHMNHSLTGILFG